MSYETREEVIQAIESREIVLSFSAIKDFAGEDGTPRKFIQGRIEKRQETEAMVFGGAFDCYFTEGEDVFFERYFILPDLPGNTKAGKDAKALAMIENPGKRGIKPSEFNQIKFMSSRLLYDHEARFALRGIQENQVRFGFDPDEPFEFMGWKFRGVADFVGYEKPKIVDLKVMADASPKKVKWVIADMLYREQLTLYKAAFFPNDRCALCSLSIERDGEVLVMNYDERAQNASLKKWEQIMSAFERCTITGDWERSYGFWAEIDNPRSRGIFEY